MTDQPLRRSEREIRDPAAIRSIIQATTVCRVGFVDAGEPYVVPLNFGFAVGAGAEADVFWFHSATSGRKVNLLRAEPRVCVQLEEDLGLVTHAEKACAWTQSYRSVMAWGNARVARDRAEACHGLDVLMRQHAGRDGWTYPDAVLDHTLVWCVAVDRISAKEHIAKVEEA